MTLPDRLSAALPPHRLGVGITEHSPAGRKIVQRGDIRRVEIGFDDAMRLALVLTVDPDENSTEIMLVHPYVELATESDLVFSPDEVRMPYPIVVETGAHSAVWTLQILERVGRLPEEALREIARVALADDPFTVSPRTGLPLAGPVDYRWAFTLQEVEAINLLAADRISAVFEDRFDSRWLSLVPASPNLDTVSLVDELTARSTVSTMEDLYAFSESKSGVLDYNTWTKQFGSDIGRDLYLSFISQFDDDLALAA